MKEALGRIPAAAALYDALRPRRPRTRYNLDQLAAHLPAAVHETQHFAQGAAPGRKLVVFATLHYWIEQAVVLGLALRGMGHEVTVAFLPYSNWQGPINRFDLQRQDLYTRRVLSPLNGLVKFVSLLGVPAAGKAPCELESAIQTASRYDAMYSLQAEDVDPESDLYRLRLERNRLACMTALSLLERDRPDTVLIPNGLVTELGVFYQTARHLGLPAVTYEFNDQREQVWVAQNDIVMHQNTDDLWQARGGHPLTGIERQKIVELEQARSQAQRYGKGTRLWQAAPTEGSDTLRKKLGLDGRPVVLLATNVLGDSLTLGRHLFASSMAEWIDRTVRYLVDRKDIQLVVRVHPGERLTKGGSMLEVVERAAPGRPENVRAIGPSEAINTYDLIGIASVGLAYTTTVGLEMAMRGLPVVLAGQTHYRGRGFTVDPSTWDEYFNALGEILSNPRSHRPSPDRVETAWNYAYRFFFEFPFNFPWRLMHFWRDFGEWPIGRVLSEEGQTAFGRTFGYLAGEGIRW
jgi:hypothetical protein